MKEINEECKQIILSLLEYSPDTGLFKWKHRRSNKCATGWFAGTLNSGGYRLIMISGRNHRAHRLAWLITYGSVPPNDIDHKNQNREDNRIENLREATRVVNRRNASRSKNNTSGFTGVVFHKSMNKWCAQIVLNRKNIVLGYFAKIDDAIQARMQANKKYGFYKNHGSPHSPVDSK
jgi:hypothetical protein